MHEYTEPVLIANLDKLPRALLEHELMLPIDIQYHL